MINNGVLKLNNKLFTIGGKLMTYTTRSYPPLPESTTRFKFSDITYDPRTESKWSGSTASRWTKLDVGENVWDYTYGTLWNFTVISDPYSSLDPGVWNDRNFDVELIDTNIPTSNDDFHNAFRNCNNLVKIHKISSKPRNLQFAFTRTGIKEVPLFDTSSCLDMSFAFNGTDLITIPLFDTSNVTTMRQLFTSCYKLENVPILNTTKVTDMAFIFYFCDNLRSLPNWDTSKVKDFENYCHLRVGHTHYIEEIPDYDVSSAKNVRQAFIFVDSAKTGIYRIYQKLAALGEQITDHVRTFESCGSGTVEGAAELAQIPNDWK